MKPARLVAALALSACILPDLDITAVNEDIQNKQAVRIVEAIELTESAESACIEAASTPDNTAAACPQPGSNPLPHFLDPAIDDYDFCACDKLMKSTKKLIEVTLYVEDRDEKTRDNELDDIYAAMQLDLDPSDKEPHLYVRYTDFVNPLVPLSGDDQITYRPVKRPDPHLRTLKLGSSDQGIDLCNDVGSLDQPLRRGYHTVRVIVTDRAWFADEDGNPQPGVPDLAAGATYDTLTYVFHCDDKTNEDDAHCLDDCVAQDGA